MTHLERIGPDWTKGLQTLLRECPHAVRRGVVVYQGTDRLASNGTDILPAADFLGELHAGRLFRADVMVASRE